VTRVKLDCVTAPAWTEGDAWQCDNETLRGFLDHFAGPEKALEAAGGYVPDMALAMARLAEERLPGAKIEKVEDLPETEKGIVY
jgi:hypothetical protein